MTIFAEETGEMDTRDVGTKVIFPSAFGHQRLGQLRKAQRTQSDSGASWAGRKSSHPFGGRESRTSTADKSVYFASETNDDSEFVPEFDSEDVLDGVLERALDGFSDLVEDASDLSDTPVQRLEQEYERVMRVTVEELDLESAVYLREGTELLAQLSDHLTMFPELEELSPECDIDKADVDVPGVTTPEMEDKMRKILSYHRSPAPAREVVCDFDVGDAMPIALCARQIVSRTSQEVPRDRVIEHSESEWSSLIVIVLKKNGEDIRILVNQLIKLSRYPLPLIDDLRTDFNAAAPFMSLDMASGFWAIRMTERAKLYLPFGHFQWIRMPFGHKNAPLVYQNVINSCLWGFVRLRPEEEVKLHVLDTGPTIENSRGEGSFRLPELAKEATVFRRNIPTPAQMGLVLSRSSYIDDGAHRASTWDQLCEDLNALLFRLRYWNTSVSLPKSEFGKQAMPAIPKITKSVQALPFPSTLNGVQSFLGSLNYYNKFIENLPVDAAVLYELDEDRIRAGDDLDRAKEAFKILKRNISSTRLLRHPDCTKPFAIIPHANPWASSTVLEQEHDGIIQPFRPLIYGSGIPIVIYTRYSVLKWLLKSNSADGRNLKWGLELSKWTLELRRVQRDEDGLAAILGAEVAENLIPVKWQIKARSPISVEMLDSDFEEYVLSFDGAAKSRRGNTALILFQCAFTGYVMGKAMADTTALRVARAFEEYSVHPLSSGMTNTHDLFTEMMQLRSRATLSYRPQANSQQEPSVKTCVYADDPLEQDWDKIAEKLIFVNNNSMDTKRKEKPFFFAHGWDAQSTLKAMSSSLKRGHGRQSDALAWR
ncbi:reverse transcriptase [Phytophthora megakarya]|uniref:Reverse transcriptase n=1 Tax=Phytophthora megakarya TaxID=4795 RepID=A0A225WFC5_9STRA|nr:reverse transcriptase [Phytophthora megakarya]